MESKRNVWYSIIRYSPDEIKGEVINVGLVLHDKEGLQTKYYLLEENSAKLKSMISNKSGRDIYKSYKDVFEYYLEKNKDSLVGDVGKVTIGSCYSEEFLGSIYEHYKNKNLFFTKPNFAKTKNIDNFFKGLLETYVGEEFIKKEHATVTAKKHLKKVFEEMNLLGTKVKANLTINPIKELEDYKVKVDFSFKNGVWNYIQTIPSPSDQTKNIEWFSKIKLMSEYLDKENSKIHLIYKESDIEENQSAYNLINFLANSKSNICKLDIDKKEEVFKLCNYIEEQGEILNAMIG
jgi:hypothetical protein